MSDVIVSQKGSNGDLSAPKNVAQIECALWYWMVHAIKNELKGNILHCTKRTQNKTRIGQWRLLFKG